MIVTRLPLTDLVPDPANAREHGSRNLDTIRSSLKLWKQVEPLVVQKSTRKIIGGNARYQVMKEIGWTEADVVEVDLNDAQATALGIVLNRASELASWQYDALAPALAMVQEAGINPLDLGFDEHEMETIMGAIFHAEGEAIDSKPRPVIAFTQEQYTMILQAVEAWRSKRDSHDTQIAEVVVSICEEWQGSAVTTDVP